MEGFGGGYVKKRNNFENVLVNGRIILNWALKIRMVVLDSIDLAQQQGQVTGCFKYGKELSSFLKCEEFMD